MARFREADRRCLREVANLLSVYVDGAPGPLADVVEPLRDLLRFDVCIAYGVGEAGARFRLTFGDSMGGRGTLANRRELADFIGKQSGKFAAYDARRPEAWNRNTVLEYADLVRQGTPTAPITRVVLPRLAVRVEDQLRVLVCEGPSLLAWVGGFRAEPYTARDRRVLGALVRPLRRRLLLTRRLESADVTRVALDIALENLPGPAFLVSPAGAVSLANAAARARLDAHPTETRRNVAQAIRGTELEWRAVPVRARGTPVSYLVLARDRNDAAGRVRAAACGWGLTPRQAQVLALVVAGASNARVAATLGISERTVETHLGAIFTRASVGSRAALAAAVLAS
jgi:DNA-binding CsgD family transcriptional regulator